MKLTKSQLKRIIQEELQKVLMREQGGSGSALLRHGKSGAEHWARNKPAEKAAIAPGDPGFAEQPLWQAIGANRMGIRSAGMPLPDGMQLDHKDPFKYIEDTYSQNNPQIQAVKRIQDQISSCAPMGVPYGGQRLKVGQRRTAPGKWEHGYSDPQFPRKDPSKPHERSYSYGQTAGQQHEQSWLYILGGVKLEAYDFALATATALQEGLPTECQQLGADLMQLLGSFIGTTARTSGPEHSGASFRSKERAVPTDPRVRQQGPRPAARIANPADYE